MLRKIFILAVIVTNVAFANSIGWPPKEELPEWLLVAIDIPPRWGSQLAVDLHGVFRIKLRNKRDSDVRILNVRFFDPQFLLIKKDGSSVPLTVPMGQLRKPELNPGMTLGARSEVGFEIEMDRPASSGIPLEGDVVFEVKVGFVAGDIVERREADGRVNPNVGWLEGFDYTVVLRLIGAKRLLK
jgi:hypothetical protein